MSPGEASRIVGVPLGVAESVEYAIERENAAYGAYQDQYAEAQLQYEEMLYLEHIDAELDWADKELAALTSNGQRTPRVNGHRA